MSQTVAEAAAAYRKRRGEKMARYEAALESIANNMTLAEVQKEFGDDADYEGAYNAFIAIARNALSPEKNDG